MRAFVLLALLAQLLLLAGCGTGVIDNTEPVGSTGAKCYPNDTCDEGLTCSPAKVCELSAAETCAGVTCSGHGTCADTSGSAVCTCDQGYFPRGLACVAVGVDGGTLSDGGSQHDSGGSQHDSGGSQHDSGGSQHDSGGSQHDSGGSQHDSGGSQHDSGGSPGCEEVPDEVFGAEPNPTCNPIGGGDGYSEVISQTDPRVTAVVGSKEQLKSALDAAAGDDVIFVSSDAVIDLSGEDAITIPDGVTVASDRGQGGATGATIRKYSGSGYSMLTVGGNNVRVTGLVLEGPNPAPETLNYLVMGVLNYDGYSGMVVDNNEIWGWSYAGVFTNGAPTSGRPFVHHNSIHNNQGDGYGYGVNINGGDALVEANIFDYNRHSVTGGGLVGEKYEFRYNIHLGHGSVVGGVHVDVHENERYSSDHVACAGTSYLIHHNTVNQGSGTAQQAFVHIRDVPQEGASIYNNLINTNWGSGTNNDGAQSVIYQSCDYSDHFGGVNATNNMWKGTLYPTNSGIVWEQFHQ
jgi:hypothetical protein